MTTERLWGLFLVVPYAVNNYMAFKNDKNTFDIKYFNKKGQDHDDPALKINNNTGSKSKRYFFVGNVERSRAHNLIP
jgi:hypothetical protein